MPLYNDIILDFGDKLIILTYALHHDSKYYPNLEIFDSERFTEKNKALRPHITFLPFSDGLRICVCE